MTQNLSDKEAIEKMREIAHNKVGFLGTYAGPYRQEARPMTTQEVDKEGNFLFFVKNDQDGLSDIRKHNNVDLLYINGSSYLALRGEASVYRSQSKIDELYHPITNAWFDGKEDPSLMILKVKPTDAHYWSTADGKIKTLYKMAKAAVAGKDVEIGVAGDLDV